MFTQQHYIKLAETIHQRRVKIKQQGFDANQEAFELQAVADLTNDLMTMLKADNPKFDKLKFIGVASKDLL